MKVWAKDSKLVVLTSAVTLLCILLISQLYVSFIGHFAGSLSRPNLFTILSEGLQNPALSSPYAQNRLVLSRIILICLALNGLLIAYLFPRQVRAIFVNFWTASTYPLNLAIFRIAFFAMLLFFLSLPQTVWFSNIPRDLIDPPKGLGWLGPYFPINATLVTICGVVLLASAVTSMIGLFTRVSTIVALISGAYFISVPQFFGKIDHIHHLLWFMAILAASRCGDALSCDAVVGAWKRADQGEPQPPGPALAYALPLRFVWFLIGIVYFFPGLRKAWDVGLDWIITDNLKYHMYAKWFDLGGWTPAFRIDQYPLMFRLSAAGTMAFELGFIFLIFFPRIRTLLAIGGVVFHSMTYQFMRISFFTLQVCYVAFFDWFNIFRRIGSWLYRHEMFVLYDGNCTLCRRTIASLRALDVFGRITYVNALDEAAVSSNGLNWLDRERLLVDMHAVVQSQTWVGFAAYRAMAARIPLLWPLLPFLYLPPVVAIGERLYRRVADSRACSVVKTPQDAPDTRARTLRPSVIAVTLVGGLLVCGNMILGARGSVTAWPMASYPPFADIKGPEVESINIVARSATGEQIALDNLTPSKYMSSPRWHDMVTNVLGIRDPQERRKAFGSLWHLWAREDTDLQRATSVEFYRVTVVTIPGLENENPRKKELLEQFAVSGTNVVQ